ncbi:yippee family [Paramyrothecium foliicola]|nr:yippee family [Paramyrothecium foliicola]
MVRDSGISATKPVFPAYLLPSFRFSLPRRTSTSSSSASGSPVSSAATTPSTSPTTAKSAMTRLARGAPDTLRCSACSTDLAFSSQIVSKGFTGRHGRAFLVAPPPPPAEQTIANVRVGRSENRQLVTGWHVVADISCSICSSKLGWKYVDAKEQAQKYKVGKFILETERIMTYRHWFDAPVEEVDLFEGSSKESERAQDDDEVVFDSEDDEECEDVFAGTWDADTVARRRSSMIARRKSEAE